MSEHELTEEKIGELWDAHEHKSTFFDDLGEHSKILFSSFARDAYDLGKQASTAQPGTGWTDDELRAAINTVKPGITLGLRTVDFHTGEPYHFLETLREVLTAMGIDHQPKPELPDTPGSVIYDVVDDEGRTYQVMTLGNYGGWCGVDQYGEAVDTVIDSEITSFGGVLDLDKVRCAHDPDS